MTTRSRIGIALSIVLVMSGAAGAAAPYPQRPIEIIAPAAAGGGWDLTARMTVRALQEERQISQPMTVTNMVGGSGAVAIAHVNTRRKGDAHVLTVMGSSLTATLARRVVPYTFRDVTPVAAITGDFQVLVARRDSNFVNLRTFIDVLRRDPALLTIAGGSAFGALDHLTFAALAKKVGVDATKVRYVPTSGGSDALTLLLGSQVTAVMTSVSEALGAIEVGQIKVLAVFAPERIGGPLRGVPTAREQGTDFVYVNWRGYYLPPEVPTEVTAFWQQTIDRMAKSKSWAKILDETKWASFLRFGEPLRQFLDQDINETASLLRELGLMR